MFFLLAVNLKPFGLHGFWQVFGVVVEGVSWDFREQMNSSLSKVKLDFSFSWSRWKTMITFILSEVLRLGHPPFKSSPTKISFFFELFFQGFFQCFVFFYVPADNVPATLKRFNISLQKENLSIPDADAIYTNEEFVSQFTNRAF